MTTSANTSKDSPPPQLRLCLSDNDWVIKLAAFDLLKDGLKRLKIQPQNVRILGTCEVVVCNAKKMAKYGSGMVAVATAFIKAASVLTDDEIDDGDFIRLTDAGIDGGEAQLFATRFQGDYFIATDDKRAMIKLATTPDLADIFERHKGRIVCMEQIVVLVAELLGYDYVDQKIRPFSWADDNILQAWAGGKGQESKEALKVIRSHITDLRNRTHGLLCSL